MSNGPKKILINAFFCGSPGQSWSGLWAHPRSQTDTYNTLEFWTDLARTCEAGLIDGVFMADALGISDVYKSSADDMLRAGNFVPALDPMLLIPAMAAVTQNLAFGITGNATYESPYLLARRFSTLDHLTRGRVAWNVVTGVLAATSRAMGREAWLSHDERYAAADDYMKLVYALWEQSWDEDAVRRDRQARVFTDPSKVRAIDHDGPYYRCQAIHLVEPSPQRTPVIFAAGSSGAGMDFLARHAECGFVSAGSKDAVRKTTADVRAKAAQAGRHPQDIKVFTGITVIVAPTEKEAHALHREYAAYNDLEGNLAFKSGYVGVDFSKYPLDSPLPNQKTNASQSALSQYASREWTIRDLGLFEPMPGREIFLIGSTQQVCDTIIEWVDETDIDGFNLVRTVEPEGLKAFCDLVVPELQNRGRYKTEYAPGTMREKLFSRGPKVQPTHQAARARITTEHQQGQQITADS